MKRIGTLREEFDREMDFVANRSFKFDGKELPVNHLFDKSLVTTRSLRQLYDGRFLRMVEPDRRIVREERAPPPPVEIGNVAEPDTPRPRVKRVKLQQAAE